MRGPKKNSIIAPAEIEKLSHDGRGITHLDGKTTFVRFALPEEKVTFAISRQHSKFNEGDAIEILTASKDRALPKCQHFSICGGCSLQHLVHPAQLTHKMQTLLDHLKHIGNIAPAHILPPLSGAPWSYRHKARLGVKYVSQKNKVLVGFREKDGRYIADIHRCEVLHPSVANLFPDISALVQSLSCFQHLPQVEVAIGDKSTALIFRHLKELTPEDKALLVSFGKKHTIDIYLQPGNLLSVYKLWPENTLDRLSYALPDQDLELFFHPNDFTQINLTLNRAMVNQALTLLDPKPHEKILDLFCGLGNFTLPIARHAAHVTGVEGDTALIERARYNAEHNRITNTEYHMANLENPFQELSWARKKYDKILLDPPRLGAKNVVDTMTTLAPERIVYVSCNPATFARDAKILAQQNYQLTHVGIIDMFPHTCHVESMGLFEKG